MQHITALDLTEWMHDPVRSPPILLDVREPWEYQICHIAGATLMPMNTVPEGYGEFDTSMPIVCICHHGVRSMKVAAFLAHNGFTQVINLTGGMHAWAQQVDTAMPTY